MSTVVTSNADPALSNVAVKPDTTMLALDRTRLAFERTTMAWVRTATSLITFGFSVYKFFNIEAREAAVHHRIITAREFGMLMISIGIISLVVATIQHWHSMKTLRAHAPQAHMPRSLSLVVAALMSVLGVMALLAVFFRR